MSDSTFVIVGCNVDMKINIRIPLSITLALTSRTTNTTCLGMNPAGQRNEIFCRDFNL